MTTQQSLQQLASGALPNLSSGDSMQPSWSRSLNELAAANKSFLGNNPQQLTSSAQLLLGDRTDFGSLVANLETTPTAPLTQDAFQSLDASRRQQRDSAIERILQRERENTNKQLEKQLEQQLEDDWKREREWWLKELVGSRNLVDASNSLGIRQADRKLEATFQSVSGPSHSSFITEAVKQPLDAVAVQKHLQLLRSITATTNLQDVIAGYQNMTRSDSTGYAIAWQLFGNMIPNLSSPFHGALGSLLHFCKQYQDVIKNRVASANLAGQNVVTDRNYGTGMGGTMATYVKLEYGADASTWHILYYCLRCGDFGAAKTVLEVARANHDHFPEQDVIQNVVYQIAQRQAQASCIWEMGTPTVSPNDRALIVDLHNKAQNLESKNIFKIGVLALLSGQNLPDGSYSTIEDYLFGHLWLALQQEDPTSQIKLIGKSIKKYGPEYFQADSSGGWGYALPLLASQQFKTALVYLAEAGGSAGLLQATHLGLVLASKGLSIIDLGEQEGSSPCLLTALLIKYASLLEVDSNSGPSAALEYLLKIPKKDKARHEIASLIVRQSHLVDQFGGILTQEGARRNALLDKYMGRDEASLVLAESADMFKRQHHDRTKAELAAKLFMLSGRYGALLVLLNELISPTDDGNPEKLFWSQQSQLFHSTYLTSRTLVVESLEREGNLGLIQVNQQLTAMRSFFDIIRGGRLQEAFQIVSSLNLLPLAQDQMNEKESRYKNLDPSLKAAMPSLICGTMECLFGTHRKIKSESRGINDTVEERLRELQMMARFIYVFAGLVNMPSSTKDFIQQKRNHML
mmetsp:Transcript_19709/g.48434  ORF Transcript_19709/g.48434 Transcript_19709/m.48434 type:complete len:803 (-) Transcript_19709:105-2513(-)|eukprot:CAMPEP_0113633056 /NCGR_PEP_ID=MMETSP0017_2-20120614/17192_1 /TAXON_ID=2856 /ORGANISM="Cylindrotheca closterium" /LENGTH=802 /DNA_ID=CAMNT_0000543657 /DNA_START=38 /DNA_END=2446 /DNA_ORIENTATION=+ /assembly_acc=CAM_ASM_000147